MDNESYDYKYASKYVRTYTYFGNSDFDESNLDKIDHWVYDVCIEGVDNKNLDPNLFKNINILFKLKIINKIKKVYIIKI